jgi:hypothetical protein
MANTPTVNSTATPNYSIDQILQATQTPKQPGAFRRVLGAVVGGVGNLVAPGIGSLIGGTISGGIGGIGGSIGIGGIGASGVGGLGSDTMQYIQLQQQMSQQQEAFETASNVLKSKHDASMAAIRNIN